MGWEPPKLQFDDADEVFPPPPDWKPRRIDEDAITYRDKYVVLYDYSEIGASICFLQPSSSCDLLLQSLGWRIIACASSVTVTDNDTFLLPCCLIIDQDKAIQELGELVRDLDSVGLHTEVRAGHEQTLLIFVKAPREVLGNYVYKSRCVLATLAKRKRKKNPRPCYSCHQSYIC